VFEQEIGIGHSARYGVIVSATHQKEIGCGKNRYVDARIGETPGGLLKLVRRQQRKLGGMADRYAATESILFGEFDNLVDVEVLGAGADI